MDSSAPKVLIYPAFELKDNRDNGISVFDTSLLLKQAKLPKEFIWPNGDLIHTQEELGEPLIDLEGFLRGDEEETTVAAELVRAACKTHGFFQVTNHGIDPGLIHAAHDVIDALFSLPLNKKVLAQRQPGSVFGYSGAHTDRYSTKLPWKETFSFKYGHEHDELELSVVDYFRSALGIDFEETGLVYQRYCESMKELSLVIFELLAIGLGVERCHFRKFFEDGNSIMRCNYYPPCKEAGHTLGTGPHCDPTSLTILHQDQIGGLEVFVRNKWQAVRPRPDAFVVNIGDTFMALSNGKFKSCLHRAVVNKESVRRSLAFFVCPKENKIVRPPQDLLNRETPRKYPDFTWSDLLEFTQKHYRADVTTLESFIHWHFSTKPSSSSSNKY